MSNHIAEIIREYYRIRRLKVPDEWQALAWAMTEVGEAYEILLASHSGWVRNNPENEPDWDPKEFGIELGDTIMMLVIAGLVVGVDPIACLMNKVREKLIAQGAYTDEIAAMFD